MDNTVWNESNTTLDLNGPILSFSEQPTGATGIGTANMQPNTALTTNNEAGVEPANVNGLDGNVDNPANDLVSQYKVQALGDFYIPSEDTDPLKYFRRDTRSGLGNKLMGKK